VLVRSLVLPAAGLVVGLAWLTRLLLPPQRALRARNAFLVRRGQPGDFAWTPAAVPPAFRQESRMPPAPIADALHDGGIARIPGDWPRALALVGMLVGHAREGGAVRADLATTWRAIVAGRGYCADYVRVYLAAAFGAGLFCRQWAFSFSGFGGLGHTFVEVFDRERGRWAVLDVHNNVYPVAQGSLQPLDALALREALRTGSPAIDFVRAAAGRLGYEHPEKLVAYYRRGADEWWLVFGNDVVTRSETGLAGAVGRWSGRLSHRLGVAALGTPALVALPSATNESALRALERLRMQVGGALALALLSLGGLVAAW